MSAMEVVDLLDAGVRDKVAAAAVRWHASYRHCQAVVDAVNDYDDCDCCDDETEAEIARCWEIEREWAENLAETVDAALRSEP